MIEIKVADCLSRNDKLPETANSPKRQTPPAGPAGLLRITLREIRRGSGQSFTFSVNTAERASPGVAHPLLRMRV